MSSSRPDSQVYTDPTPLPIALAAVDQIAIAEGCTWVTRDRDFGRFEPAGLRWQHLVL